MKNCAYIALNPTVTTDEVDSASWDLNWSFRGTIAHGEPGPDKIPTKDYTPKDFTVYDEELGQSFTMGKGISTLYPRVSKNFKEDQYGTKFDDTKVSLIHDDSRSRLYLVVYGNHYEEVATQARAVLATVDDTDVMTRLSDDAE